VPGSTQSTSLEQSLVPNPHQLHAMIMYQDGIRGHIPTSAPCPKALDNTASAAVSELRDKSPSDLMLQNTPGKKMPGPKFMTLFS